MGNLFFFFLLKNKKGVFCILGLLIGTLNGLFGAGGGIIAVPFLRKMGIEGHRAHASSVAIILPLSLVSFIFYLIDGRLSFDQGIPYILPGIIGAIIGPVLLRKIPSKLLRKIFAILIVYAGIRMVLR